MGKIKLLKAGSQLVVNVGVGMIVSNVVNSTSKVNPNVIQKVCVGAGSLVLGSILSDHATDYMDEKFDGMVTNIKNLFANGYVKVEETEEEA